jgi:hypothetical protein
MLLSALAARLGIQFFQSGIVRDARGPPPVMRSLDGRIVGNRSRFRMEALSSPRRCGTISAIGSPTSKITVTGSGE